MEQASMIIATARALKCVKCNKEQDQVANLVHVVPIFMFLKVWPSYGHPLFVQKEI